MGFHKLCLSAVVSRIFIPCFVGIYVKVPALLHFVGGERNFYFKPHFPQLLLNLQGLFVKRCAATNGNRFYSHNYALNRLNIFSFSSGGRSRYKGFWCGSMVWC